LLRCGESPMVIGCRSPQIVCRDDLDPREMRMVFAHELIHCKYLDNPILLFSTCVACLFWFNPLIWVVRNILREDLEVLCDERSLTYCQIPHTEYALMLCRSCAYSELVLGAGCHMSASGRRLKNRLRTISTGKNRKFLPKAASVLLCAAIVMVCLTNPIVSQNSDYSAYIENYAELTGGDERAMHLSQQETVSSYLSQMAAVLKDWYGENCAHSIGNGSLERFKRLCAAWNIPKEILTNIQMLRTDEPLTVKNCALLNACMTVMLESEIADGTETVLLPRVITEQDLQSVLDHLTETEANALLKCYNRGVAGADVSFDAFYSEAMMELICSRINDSWAENKFTGFYHVLNLKGKDLSSFNTAFRDLFAALRMDSVYVCDPTITSVEKEKLAQILGCAYAGQQEDVYYLKKTEDGCSFEIAERLMKRGGFTPEQMLVGYAKIGEAPEFDIYRGCRLAVVRTDEPVIIGAVRTEIADAVRYMYSLGLIDAENGTIDLTQRLSCGQGIAYVYRMAAAIIPIT
ncbi:MAG: M56 family metallopeptidase, partial [Clostridia bacterium]|nr:M56 family metallopeptidase [Clostridia bacterium]